MDQVYDAIIQKYIDNGNRGWTKVIEQIAYHSGNSLQYQRKQYQGVLIPATILQDSSFTNSFIENVIEIDFNQFYPESLMQVQTDMPTTVVNIMLVLLNLKQRYMAMGKIPQVSACKLLMCSYIGGTNWVDQSYTLLYDPYVYYRTLEQANIMIHRLINTLQEQDAKVFLTLTDAVFIQYSSPKHLQQILNSIRDYNVKTKIHTTMYKFSQTNKYISITNRETICKDFAKDIPTPFADLCRQALLSKDISLLTTAFTNPLLQPYPNLLKKLTDGLRYIPNLPTNDLLLYRIEGIEYKGGQAIKKQKHLYTSKQAQKQQQGSSTESIHEYMQPICNFVLDIDIKGIAFNEYEIMVRDVIRDVLSNHLIQRCAEYKPIDYYISKYTSFSLAKASYHLLFKIALPVQLQKVIATELMDNSCRHIDIAIYNKNHTIRIPETISTKDNLTPQQRIECTLKIQDGELTDHLVNNLSHSITLTDTFISSVLLTTGLSFDYTHSTTLNSVITIEKAIKDYLNDQHIQVESFKYKGSVCTITLTPIPIYICLICQRSHDRKDNQNLRAVIGASTISLNCFRNQDRTLQHTISYSPDPIDKPITTITLTDDLSQPSHLTPSPTFIHQRYIMKNLNDRYVIDNRSLLCIRSDMGTGKGTLIQSQLEQHKKVLIVSTRKLFTLSNQQRLGLSDSQIYTNMSRIEGTAICQVESLHKVSEDVRYDVLVLDEFQSILQQISNASTIGNDSLKYYIELCRVIHQSRRVLVLDAQLTRQSITLLQNIIPKYFTHNTIINTYKPFRDNTISIYSKGTTQDKVQHLVSKIIERYNKGLATWFVCTKKKLQYEIADILSSQCPNINIKLFNGDHNSTEVDGQDTPHRLINKQFFLQPDVNFNQIDLVIATSTITCGLDINLPKFNYVIGLLHDKCITPQQSIQSLHRCRYVKHIDLYTQSLKTSHYFKSMISEHITSLSITSIKQDIFQPATQVKMLADQYVQDLSFCGIDYVIFQLQQMGYQISYTNVQTLEPIDYYQSSICSKSIVSQQIDSENVLALLCSHLPEYFPTNSSINNIIQQYTTNVYDYSGLLRIIHLAQYEITQSIQCLGYGYSNDFTYNFPTNPHHLIQAIKEYINQFGESSLQLILSHSTPQQGCLDALLLFINQYQKITELRGITFRQEYYSGIKLSRQCKGIVTNLIHSPQFNDKRYRYTVMREQLSVTARCEAYRDIILQDISAQSFLSLSMSQVAAILNQPSYDACRLKCTYYNYLGFHCETKRQRCKGVQRIRHIPYDSDYLKYDDLQ